MTIGDTVVGIWDTGMSLSTANAITAETSAFISLSTATSCCTIGAESIAYPERTTCHYCKAKLRRKKGDMCAPCQELLKRNILKYDSVKGEYYKGKTRKIPEPTPDMCYPFIGTGSGTTAGSGTYTTTDNTTGGAFAWAGAAGSSGTLRSSTVDTTLSLDTTYGIPFIPDKKKRRKGKATK